MQNSSWLVTATFVIFVFSNIVYSVTHGRLTMLLVNIRKQTVLCLSIQVCDVRNLPYMVCHVTTIYSEFSRLSLNYYGNTERYLKPWSNVSKNRSVSHMWLNLYILYVGYIPSQYKQWRVSHTLEISENSLPKSGSIKSRIKLNTFFL